MDTKAKVGKRVRAIRKQRRLSQAELADSTHRSIETISSIERGKALPNFETLERLAETLDVQIKEFFSFDLSAVSMKRDALIAEINASLLVLPDRELKLAADLIKTLETHLHRG